MRRLALLGLCCVTLSGCGFPDSVGLPFVAGSDPYAPAGQSENLLRARGEQVPVAPLKQAGGNVWPGPVKPTPSLETLVKQERSGQIPPIGTLPNQPKPPPVPALQGRVAPKSAQPVVPYVPPPPTPARPGAKAAPSTPGVGSAVQTPEGPGVTTGSTGAFKTITLPNGTTGIVVPNGNGTSTIIFSNGQVQTIPAPK